MERSQGHLDAIINAIADPIFVKDRRHRWVLLNAPFCRMLGFDREALIGKSDYDFFPQHEADLFWENDEIVFRTGQEHVSEESFTDAQGVLHAVSTKKTLFVDRTGAKFIVGITRDVTERRQVEEKLRQLAFYDPLTGLANRSLFEERLRQACEDARHGRQQVALLFIDLDHFKMVNDTLGHHVGDRLLIAVAQRLQSSLRSQDLVARFAGDEFACLLESDAGDAPLAADRVNRALQRPFELEGTRVHISGSIGIACGSGRERPEDLLRFADIAMYRAKQKSGANFQVFDLALDSVATNRLHIQNELWHALERQEIVVHYQPLVRMRSGRICGAEALVRWQHPSRGMMPPSDFIAIAEETGLIVSIGEWVLRQACHQAARWKDAMRRDEPFMISINLSARQLQDPCLVDLVQEILRETGLAPEELVLEITENVLLQTTSRAHELRRLGVRLAIDDFGTGYASLAYLKELPVQILKMAPIFTASLGEDRVGASIVRTILGMSRDLKLTSIVEGIETKRQAALLHGMKCDLGQGFLFSPAVPAREFTELLQLTAVLTGRRGAAAPSPAARAAISC